MKHLFIVNPAAGKKDRTEFVAAKVAMAMSERQEDYEIYVTKAPKDAVDKIRREAADCPDLRVYACGGDGTLNECVSAAVGLENVAVTHFPCGTGNDFIKMFGPEKESFFDLSQLIDGEIRPLDVIRCNDSYSMNICSVGIDARIGVNVHKYSSIPLIGGPTGYVVSSVVEVFKGIARPLKIRCAGRSFEGEMTLVCACNGQFYGGGFHPVPNARPDDGVLDFLVIKKVSRPTFFRLLVNYAKGLARRYPQYITHLRAESMVIDSDEPLTINLDGEAVQASHVEFTVMPGAVRFIVPSQMKFFESETAKNEENNSKWEISVK